MNRILLEIWRSVEPADSKIEIKRLAKKRDALKALLPGLESCRQVEACLLLAVWHARLRDQMAMEAAWQYAHALQPDEAALESMLMELSPRLRENNKK